jgi:hypothetical protein
MGLALEYLAQDPHPIGAALGRKVYAENNRRRVRSVLFNGSIIAGLSVAAREAAAEAHPDYLDAMKQEREAAQEYEEHRMRVVTARAVIEIWRTQNANIRASESVR